MVDLLANFSIYFGNNDNRPLARLDRWEQILGMLFACKQVALATKNGEPQVYRDVHENSLIAPSIILPKVENTANDNVKRSTFSRPADAPDIEPCKKSIN